MDIVDVLIMDLREMFNHLYNLKPESLEALELEVFKHENKLENQYKNAGFFERFSNVDAYTARKIMFSKFHLTIRRVREASRQVSRQHRTEVVSVAYN